MSFCFCSRPDADETEGRWLAGAEVVYTERGTEVRLAIVYDLNWNGVGGGCW